MTTWQGDIPYFTKAELCCKCCGSTVLDINLAVMLPNLRQMWGKKLTLNSVCRCTKHNEAVKGHPSSMHLVKNPKWPTEGAGAADIAWRNWQTPDKLRFARLAHDLGFRVGLHNGFCHVDIGRLYGIKPTPFIYGDWSNQFAVEDVL